MLELEDRSAIRTAQAIVQDLTGDSTTSGIVLRKTFGRLLHIIERQERQIQSMDRSLKAKWG
jgi:hypothetical protein